MKPKINQSLIKAFENPDRCTKKINAQYVANTHLSIPSLAMLKGTYFESKALGNSSSKEENISLPKKKNGEASVDEVRIDLQVLEFPKVLIQNKIEFPKAGAIQLNLESEYRGWTLKGALDFVTKKNNEVAIFDLKLTKDRDNSYGDFCWGMPEEMDHLQAWMYTYLFIKQYKPLVNPNFYYLLFDYKTSFGNKLIHIEYDEEAESKLTNRIDRAIAKIEDAIEDEWPAIPSPNACKNCPLFLDGSCEERLDVDLIIGDTNLDPDSIWS